MNPIHLRPVSTAFAQPDATIPDAAGASTSPDNTVLEQERSSAAVAALKTPQVSAGESAAATLRESIAAKIIRGVEYADIPSQEGFDVTKVLGTAAEQYTVPELEFLSDSRSTAELQQRQGQVQTTRSNYSAMGQNLGATIAASLFDVDLVIGMGVGKLATLPRTARMVIGLGANAAALGIASEGGHISALDVVGTSVGVALSAVPRVRKAVSAAEDVSSAERTATHATTDSPTPTKPPVATDVVENTSATGRTTEYVPDTDYTPPRIDTTSTRPHIEVGRSGEGSSGTIRTDMANAVRAVVNLGDDLPEGVRSMGRALLASFDAGDNLPVVFRKGLKGERSAVVLSQNGDIAPTIRNTALGDTLGEHIQSLSTYDKTILLHEAAHAKTIRTMALVRSGELTTGPQADAVRRISDIRQYVASITGETPNKPDSVVPGAGRYNIGYALKNDDEFIAQMFNSDTFRTHLQGIKMPGAEGTVWSELVRRVVQAFTGKAPEGTAFDAVMQEFDNLLKLPQAERTVSLRAPASVPELNTPSLRASAPQEMAKRVQTAVNSNFALYDRIKSYGAKAADLADKLVVDATGTSASSAAHYTRTAHLAGTQGVVMVDDAMARALKVDWPLAQRVRHPVAYKDAQRALSDRVYNQLAENHARHLKGDTILPNADPRVDSIVKSFADSKWAEDQLARMKAAGVEGAENVEASPYYLPRQHSGDKMSAFLRRNADVTRDDVVGMYASQFKAMFTGMEDTVAKKIGGQMVRNMEERAAHNMGYRQSIAGMTYNEIEDALVNAGVDSATVSRFLADAAAAGKPANRVRNLRHRADFDMTADYTAVSGRLINPQMFVNSDVMGLMEGYTRRMSGRIGLSQAGYSDIKLLTKDIDAAVSEAVDPSKAAKTLDDTINQLLGYPTGEQVPDILRSLSVVGGAVNLANSGIYQLADAGLMLQQFGLVKTFKALTKTKFGRDAMALARDPTYGARLQDVLESRNVLSGKYRSILTHLEDNHDIGSLGVTHQYIQKMGQGTRFANGMEFVRRGQSKMVAGLIADTVDDAIKGNASAVTAMERFGLNQDILARVRAATTRNPDMRMWPDDLRLDMETIGHNMADSIVLENRLGEIPAWMQFSAVGKVVLPYMTFVAGAWNKILRRTATLDGASGVAMAMAYQMPLATISSTAAMFLGGQGDKINPTSVATRTMTQLPIMSWLGFGVDFATRGPTNSIAALSILDKMYSATSTIAKGEFDPSTLVKAVPFLGIVPGVRLAASSMTDDD